MKPIIAIFILLAFNQLACIANEDRPDASKGEGVYPTTQSQVRVFDVKEHNLHDALTTSIEGDVRNITTSNIPAITVVVDFFTRDRKLLAYDTDETLNLASNAVWSFKVYEPVGTVYYKVVGVVMNLDDSKGEGVYTQDSNKVQIDSVKQVDVDNADAPTSVVGKVTNLGSSAISIVTVTIGFYHMDRSRVEVDDVQTTDLQPGEVWQFKHSDPDGTYFYKVLKVVLFR